jgi:hypothetical protein
MDVCLGRRSMMASKLTEANVANERASKSCAMCGKEAGISKASSNNGSLLSSPLIRNTSSLRGIFQVSTAVVQAQYFRVT